MEFDREELTPEQRKANVPPKPFVKPVKKPSQKKHYIDANGKRRTIGSFGRVRNPAVRAWARKKEQDILAGVEKKIGDSGHIYIVHLGFEGLYKVGCTIHIERRMKELRASNPHAKCIWSAWVKDMKEVEKRVHNLLKDNRVDREIFKLTEGAIRNVNGFVNNIKAKY